MISYDALLSADFTTTAKLLMLDLTHRADEHGRIANTTQQQMADRLGVTRLTVSKALKSLEAAGLVHPTFGGGLVVKPVSGFLSRPSVEDEPSPAPEPPRAPERNQTPPVPVEVEAATPVAAPVAPTDLMSLFDYDEDEDEDDDRPPVVDNGETLDDLFGDLL